VRRAAKAAPFRWKSSTVWWLSTSSSDSCGRSVSSKSFSAVLHRRKEHAERRTTHIAELRKRAAEAEAKLKRLYDARVETSVRSYLLTHSLPDHRSPPESGRGVLVGIARRRMLLYCAAPRLLLKVGLHSLELALTRAHAAAIPGNGGSDGTARIEVVSRGAAWSVTKTPAGARQDQRGWDHGSPGEMSIVDAANREPVRRRHVVPLEPLENSTSAYRLDHDPSRLQ